MKRLGIISQQIIITKRGEKKVDYLELLQQIFEVCVIPLLGILTTFLVKYLQSKIGEVQQTTSDKILEKYLTMLSSTITTCVISTNQTYVDSLKAQGKFDLEAQQVAFQMTYEAVISILGDEAVKYLTEALGDLEQYITKEIEANVNTQKAVTANAA